MDLFLSGSEGVTGLCSWQLRQARSRFLFQSTRISSQEHWLQSFGKANWIVSCFNDSRPSGATAPLGSANAPVGFARHVSRAEEDLSVPKKAPPFLQGLAVCRLRAGGPAVKDNRITTSSMTSHGLRLHGRRLQLAEPTGRKDDHAPLFSALRVCCAVGCAPRPTCRKIPPACGRKSRTPTASGS